MKCSLASLIYILWIYNNCQIGGIQAETGILDDSLFTFQDHACENNKLVLLCPYGTTISVKWAVFGRTQPYELICPFRKNIRESALVNKSASVDCQTESALQIVLDQCQDRHRCRLLASTKVFGQDPCPTVSKYLEVAYKCRPNEFRSRVGCEGEQLDLHCSKRRERLAVYSATFGWARNSQWASDCAEYAPNTRDCGSQCAFGRVKHLCHGKRRCNILVSDRDFNSDCEPGTPKYLEIIYTCVKRRILEDIDDEADYPDPCVVTTTAAPTTPQTEGTEFSHWQDPDILEIPPEGEEAETIAPDYDLYRPGVSNGNYDMGGGEYPWVPDPELTEDPDTGAVQEGVSGFVSNWIYTWSFFKENTEKLIMYIVLGVLIGIICVLLVIIIRLSQLRRRGKHEAKLNISEPIANSSAAQAAESTSLLEPSDQSEGVEMTSYNQIGSMHRPPVSSFTDPYEEETPVTFATSPTGRDPHGTFGRSSNPTGKQDAFSSATMPNSNHGYPRNNHHHGNGSSAPNARPNHTRQTSFSGSLGRNTQPGTLTGSLNRRDHWTNEYRNEGHSHTLQHYYG